VKLQVEKLWVERRGRELLSDVELTLERGELVALVGPNGAGKTTLLRALLGFVQPKSGRVLLDERPVAALAPRERAARIAWLPQHSSSSADDLSAVEVVAAARYRFDEAFGRSEQEARKALARCGVAAVADRALATLSGGERQRVALAALLAQDAPILLVDEPGNHLDPAQQIEVYRLLGELWREGRSIVCVTHDVNLLRHLGEPERVRVAGVSQGKLAFECRFDAPEFPERLGSLFGVKLHSLLLGTTRVLVPEPAP
jgi:iron complex transport system ATP-binding protein